MKIFDVIYGNHNKNVLKDVRKDEVLWLRLMHSDITDCSQHEGSCKCNCSLALGSISTFWQTVSLVIHVQALICPSAIGKFISLAHFIDKGEYLRKIVTMMTHTGCRTSLLEVSLNLVQENKANWNFLITYYHFTSNTLISINIKQGLDRQND